VSTGGIAFVIDVTERKKAEETLSKVEEARKKKSIIESRIICKSSHPCLTFRLKSSKTKRILKTQKSWRLSGKDKGEIRIKLRRAESKIESCRGTSFIFIPNQETSRIITIIKTLLIY
jgi:hypothetical protein